MTVQALGYIGVRAKNLEDWAGYGVNFLGLQRIDKSRADRWRSAWTTASSGWWWMPTAGRASASSAGRWRTRPRSMHIAARLEKMGTKVARGSRALADERQVKDLVVCNDPGGNRLEFFHGGAVASDPFKPGRNISGFRTGTLGMGHVVMHCEKPERGDAVLPGGARSSSSPTTGSGRSPATFFHVNGRHHSHRARRDRQER